MIGLVETGWQGAAFAIGDINEIGPVTKDYQGNRWQQVELRDGRSYRMSDNEVTATMRRPVQILPAAPSTDMAHWWDDENGGISVGFVPVIAWALCLDGELRPMTTAGVNDGLSEPEEGNFVRLSGGRIHGVGAYGDCAYFNDVDEFRGYLTNAKDTRERHAAAVAAHAAPQAALAEGAGA